MFASLSARDGFRGGFGIMHFRSNVFAFPGGEDARVEGDDVFGAFADLGGVEDDVVVVVVEDEGDVEFFAEREEFVDAPADVVVFEDEAVFDALWEGGVILAETGEGGFLVAEDAAEMEDHNCVTVLLRG